MCCATSYGRGVVFCSSPLARSNARIIIIINIYILCTYSRHAYTSNFWILFKSISGQYCWNKVSVEAKVIIHYSSDRDHRELVKACEIAHDHADGIRIVIHRYGRSTLEPREWPKRISCNGAGGGWGLAYIHRERGRERERERERFLYFLYFLQRPMNQTSIAT